MFGYTVKLKDEFETGQVALWSLEKVSGHTYVPEGTVALVLGHSLNGYLLVQIDGDIWEVWHENSLSELN